MRKLTRALGIVAALALVPTAALAAPGGKNGGGGKTGTSFVIPSGPYGGTTTATVAKAPAMTWIESTCYQDGRPVIYNRVEVGADGTAVLGLGPTSGYEVGNGGATCHAEAKYWHLKRQRWVALGTTTHLVTDA